MPVSQPLVSSVPAPSQCLLAQHACTDARRLRNTGNQKSAVRGMRACTPARKLALGPFYVRFAPCMRLVQVLATCIVPVLDGKATDVILCRLNVLRGHDNPRNKPRKQKLPRAQICGAGPLAIRSRHKGMICAARDARCSPRWRMCDCSRSSHSME